MWQHQLGNIGKVHPVPLPSHLSELGHGTTPEACARYILVSTCSKVQEVRRGEGLGLGKGEGGKEGKGKEMKRREGEGRYVREGERCQSLEEEVGEGEGSEYYREGVEGKEVSYTLVAQ